MVKVKHVVVGESLDSIEYHSEDAHEIIGDIVSSEPPSTYHKIYGIYAKKIGQNYRLVMVIETEPEP